MTFVENLKKIDLKNFDLKQIDLDKLNLNQIDLRYIIILLVIRTLYLFLTYKLLNNTWYIGRGSYDISFSVIKEIFAVLTYIVMTYYFVISQKIMYGQFPIILLNMLYLIYIMPVNCSFSLNNLTFGYFILTTIFEFMLIYIISNIAKKTHNKRIHNIKSSYKDIHVSRYVIMLVCFICISYILYKFLYNGFTFKISLSGDSVYSTRADYVNSLQSLSKTPLGYLLSWITASITYACPIYLIISLKKRSKFGIFISLFTVLCEFSVSSEKSVLLYPIIVFAVIFLSEKGNINKFKDYILYAVLLLFVICLIELAIRGTSTIYMLIVRRIFYYPAWLNSLYYDFFKSHKALHWSQNVFILQKIIPNVYSKGPLDLISKTYYNGEIPSPNTGLFAEVFMHFKYLGIIIYFFLYTLFFKVANFVYKQFGALIEIIVAIKLAMALTNVPITRTDFVLSFIFVTPLLWICQNIKIKRKNGRLVVVHGKSS